MESKENNFLTEKFDVLDKMVSTENVKVRCPNCMKLYVVKTESILESKPRFECSDCKSLFWMIYPECLGQEEVVGFPGHWLEDQKQALDPVVQPVKKSPRPMDDASQQYEVQPLIFNCPKCEAPYPSGQKECGACGLVFAKFEMLQSPSTTVSASSELKLYWENVLTDYENENAHQKFIRACNLDDNLAYAAAKYRSILEVASEDPQADVYLKQIAALMSLRLPFETQVEKNQGVLRAKKAKRRMPFFMMVMMLATVLMVVGFFFPVMRNLTGFGAALMFLALALRFSL